MPRMIPEPEEYFASLNVRASTQTSGDAVFAQACRSGIPVVGPVFGRLLELLGRLTGARMILELGTAIGYSTLHLAHAAQAHGGMVVGVDMNPEHCKAARNTLAQTGLASHAMILCSDARELPFADNLFDMIFLDVDQRYYEELEAVCYRQLRRGGLLVADNTAFADARPFNNHVASSSHWLSVNLLAFLPQHAPERDGLCLAMKL